jgi:mono/diheme cytochrome c family protein
MTMQRRESLIAAALILFSGAAWAQAVPRGDVLHGKKIFATHGCYECHGYQGQGSNAGSRLAPSPAPYVAFEYQLRQPRARMPSYSLKILSSQDVADIYAYLLTIPKSKAVADIPLLSGLESPVSQ